MVISSYDPAYPGIADPYTSGPRPLIKISSGMNPGLFAWGGYGDYSAIVGIEIYAHDRDPSSPTFNSSTVAGPSTGISYLSPFNWLLIEDCKISFFNLNVDTEATMNPGPNGNLYFRRNTITDSYGIAGSSNSMSHGMLVTKTTTTLVENLFDHNGWNTSVLNAGPSQFNHNIYVSGYQLDSVNGKIPPNTGYLSVATVQGNIFSNDSSGSQFRSGGTVDNNLFVANPYPHNIGAPVANVVNSVTNNVYLQGYTGLGTGWGPATMEAVYNGDYYNLGTVTFSSNIVANAQSSNSGIVIQSGYAGSTITGNIIFNWLNPIVDNGTGTIITNNNLDVTGTNANPGGSAPAEPFPAPTRSVGSYYATLGLGGTGQLSDFLSAARLQSKGNWNSQLMAAAVNSYIRAGFGLAGTVPTLGPTLQGSQPTTQTNASSTAPNTSSATPTTSTSANTSTTSTAPTSSTRRLHGSTPTFAGTWTAPSSTVYSSPSNTSSASTGALNPTESVASTGRHGGTRNSTAMIGPTSAPLTIAITSLSNGEVFRANADVKVSVSATGPSPIASITIMGDSTNLKTCTGTASCSAIWSGSNINQGTHTVNAIAVDTAGNQAEASVSIVDLP
jgi:hypothetical protein